MNGADTLRVLNRTVERLNDAEEKYRRADWERMCLMAHIEAHSRDFEDSNDMNYGWVVTENDNVLRAVREAAP